MSFKITIDKADVKYSLYIRYKANWICKRCFGRFEVNSQGLHCAHFYSRGHESTRYDDENCDALCFGCHTYFHKEPDQHKAWKIKQIGQRNFDLLTLRTHSYKKKDRLLDYIFAKELLKKAKENYEKHLT